MVAALVYVGFGAAGGAGARRLALEIFGVLLYGAAAWAGLRGRPWLLALAWAAHVGWDVLLHLSGAGRVALSDLVAQAESLGVAAIVKKPWSPQALRSVVQKVIDSPTG